ncbi:MAG: hypothetical protein LBH82_04445, partial [Bacteroidales bacterium]|nr:hypothetical protein [Bacteroidales bacterium]
SLDDLAYCADYCLSDKGCFTVILPAENARKLIACCESRNLFCVHVLHILSFPSHKANRTLLRFSRQQQPVQTDSLPVRNAESNYSDEYKELTKAFYLMFSGGE